MKSYNIIEKCKDGIERKKTVHTIHREILNDNPDTIVEYKSQKHGLIWTGRAKFMTGALVHDAFKSTVQSIEVNQYGVTIFVR